MFDEGLFSNLIFDRAKFYCVHGNISDKLNSTVSWRKNKNLLAILVSGTFSIDWIESN